jgi:hypothetical protein
MEQRIRKRRRKSSSWRIPNLRTIHNKIWIAVVILVLAIAFATMIGPIIVELDQYLDTQKERLKAKP